MKHYHQIFPKNNSKFEQIAAPNLKIIMDKSSVLVRVILSFRSPQPHEMRYLTSLLSKSKTIEAQQLYIASPDKNLLYGSSDPIQNHAAIQQLINAPWSHEVVEKLKNIDMGHKLLQ